MCRSCGKLIQFFGIEWRADGGALAISGMPFNCPLFDTRWSRPYLFVGLTGPSCGASSRLGRLIVLSAEDGSVRKEIAIGRKSIFWPAPEGTQVVTNEDGATFIPVARPEQRATVAIEGLLDWHCC